MDYSRFTDPRYNAWRYAIYDKDSLEYGPECVACGAIYADKRGIHAAHIKSWKSYPELRYDVNNGRVLCRACHKILHPWLYTGGGGFRGYTHSEETKQKMRLAHLGKTYPQISRALRGIRQPKISAKQKGVPLSQAHSAAISAGLKGYKKTKEHQEALTASLRITTKNSDINSPIVRKALKSVTQQDRDEIKHLYGLGWTINQIRYKFKLGARTTELIATGAVDRPPP